MDVLAPAAPGAAPLGDYACAGGYACDYAGAGAGAAAAAALGAACLAAAAAAAAPACCGAPLPCGAAAAACAPAGAPPRACSPGPAGSDASMDAADAEEHAALDALLAAAARKPVDAAAPAAAQPAPARPAATTVATPPLPPAAACVAGVYGAARVPAGCNDGLAAAAGALISAWGLADTFYVYDFGEVARLHAAWRAALPRVAPFYAVKCNPEPGLLAMLDALGCGFDCASVAELQAAAALGVPQERIIFANPCKRAADFRYAAAHGVRHTTFDCASELEKIAAGYPAFKCVLRIRCDDESCKINLGLKYGADPQGDVPELLALARDLNLEVVGVSFHVGSGCQNVGVYAEAIRRAREAFDAAPAHGFHSMALLDIGGGFTAPYDAASADLFYRTAAVINGALDEHFPAGCGVRVIAEPGRYFAETSATLFTTILGQRAGRGADGAPRRDYHLSDGTYGSFRIQVAVDGLAPSFRVLRSPLLPPPPPGAGAPAAARLVGDSGRDGDCVHADALLPALRDGDWLQFPYAGAYTICSASSFAGGRMAEPTKLFVVSSEATRDLGDYNDEAARAGAGCGGAAVAAAAAAAAASACCIGRCPSDDAMSTSSCDTAAGGCCGGVGGAAGVGAGGGGADSAPASEDGGSSGGEEVAVALALA
ncbi:ornithine decarboxylase [Raphidocelis subcapitata]|uniref:ornithine decarboxylase n=1 Tax=Raphidocelis subcapitata TaxID=307507 RepID=A0A2V0NLU2_9CHLO|nr:ornithine decarboxylase [Raphidocelis subcapitata]|eukprot:GBF87342.1 ornithine decarboxylase [Raphidocelis subcapitata]